MIHYPTTIVPEKLPWEFTENDSVAFNEESSPMLGLAFGESEMQMLLRIFHLRGAAE